MKYVKLFESFKTENIRNDEEYMNAIAASDLQTINRLVKIKAISNGYSIGPVYHGTDEEFNYFDISKVSPMLRDENNMHFYFAFKKSDAQSPKSGYSKPKRVIKAYIRGTVQGSYPGEEDILSPSNADYVRMGNFRISVKYPEQIKYADPITYDNSGKVIPLSKRFDSKKKDMRF